MRTHPLRTPLRFALAAAAPLIAVAGALLGVPLPGSAQKAKKEIPVRFLAPTFSAKEVNGQTIYSSSSGVVIESEGSTLKTERATYNRTTGVATAPERVQLDDPQNTLTGDKGVAYYARRDAEITGNVKIVARPKQGEGATSQSEVRREFKEPVTITCDRVVYNWRTRKAVLTGNLTVKQKDRTITATRGFYDGIEEKVDLVGDVKSVRPGNKENILVPGASGRATAILREGAESLLVNADKNAPGGKNTIQADVLIEEDETESGPGGTTPPTNPPPTTPPPAVPPPTNTPPPTGGTTTP